MTIDVGFDFRATAGYVTDPAYGVPVLSEAYPHTYTNANGDSLNGGWESGPDGGADRNSLLDARLAGINYVSNNSVGVTFRADVPATGDYNLSLAVGDTATTNTVWSLLVIDTASTLLTLDSAIIGTQLTNHYVDAAGTIHATAALWAVNQAPVTKTFASTICRVKIGSLASGDFTTLAHFRLTQVSTLTAAQETPAFLDFGGMIGRQYR